MCTVSWFPEPNGYQLFFNRDERRSRRPGAPPTIRERGTVRYIAPTDGDHGGTWLAVNERGLGLGLLNGYQETADESDTPRGGWPSRGSIVPELIDAPDPEAVVARLSNLDLTRFRSFWLLALPAGGLGQLARWRNGVLSVDGSGGPAELDPIAPPLVSSSFDTEQVRAARTLLYRELDPSAEPAARTAAHLAFHRSHRPERGAYSPCMHRPDAHTVSFSHVRVTPDRVSFDYRASSPCRDDARDATVALLRRDVAASLD